MNRNDVIRVIEDLKKSFSRKLHHQKMEAMFEVNSKYKFSRNWYQANFDVKDYDAVDVWCEQQFGEHPARPDAWSRWWHKFEDSILFRDREDYMMFVLRWGIH
jgi:hypothetical protein